MNIYNVTSNIIIFEINSVKVSEIESIGNGLFKHIFRVVHGDAKEFELHLENDHRIEDYYKM